MSDCLHCEIHELLDSKLQGEETNLAEIAAKVTEVLADIVMTAPPEDQSTLLADIIANLGTFLLEKKEEGDPGLPPEKWSSLKYGLWPDGGLRNAEKETQGGRDSREAAAG